VLANEASLVESVMTCDAEQVTRPGCIIDGEVDKKGRVYKRGKGGRYKRRER
jgi:hypothetical protein